MPPISSLAGILDSPVASSNGSTVVGGGGTLPDISLGSLGSSFHSADDGEYDDGGMGTPRNDKAQRRKDTSFTPLSSQTPASALVAVSPPTSVRRTSSQSALDQGAPRRSRYMRSSNAKAKNNDSGSDSDGDALAPQYGGDTVDSDEDGVLGSLSVNVTHRRAAQLRASGTSYAGGPSKRSGRHSVAANPTSNQMTLREQEQNVDALQKENFNLQLENHFLKERLASMAPDHIEAALKENVKLKIEILNLGKELKKCKRLLMQQDRDLAAAAGEGKSVRSRDAESRELEALYRQEKEKRDALEEEIERLRDLQSDKASNLEDDLDQARGQLEDQAEEMAKLQDAHDRAQDELDQLREQQRDLGESVGVSKGRESRQVQRLEQEVDELKAEIEQLLQGHAELEVLEEQNNQLRDKYAAAQIDLDRHDEEIEELNNEIDLKVQEHEKEIQQVEAEWRDEVLETRAHVDELKDVLQEREQDLEEARKAFIEREEELIIARDRIGELEAVQGETHDRLEETLRNIEMDNAEKDGDLIAANREVESLGQRVYDLEEMIDELRGQENDLNIELQRADEEKAHFVDLVAALKEARRKAQDERDDEAVKLRREEDAHDADREAWENERATEAEQHRRALASRDQVNERLTTELEAARDRVAMRDRDLASVQNALRGVEDERRKLGDEQSSGRQSLELEIQRLHRDFTRCEDELDRAREELRDREQALHDRDLELAELMDKHRDLEGKLVTERQGRLNISDKLDAKTKEVRHHEREAANLRERLEDLEPLLTETQNSRFQMQKESDRQRQERTDLLLRVFKDVNRFLGVTAEDNVTPANFGVFRDTLIQRLRSISGARSDFDKRIKETEVRMEQKMAGLKRQLDAKWRALDAFESSVKKLELTRSQWRSRLSLKDGELDAFKARNAELQAQLSAVRASGGAESSSHIRSLIERAQMAEKRSATSAQSIAQLEARIAELQSRAGVAETKWEARVKEYEARLRQAGEKVKAEKQGGKERAHQLEAQVRELERLLAVTQKNNKRAEGVVANAAHLMDN